MNIRLAHYFSTRRAWGFYFSEGHVFYQFLDEIPCDGTFVFSEAEVDYVDRMAVYLFGSDPGARDVTVNQYATSIRIPVSVSFDAYRFQWSEERLPAFELMMTPNVWRVYSECPISGPYSRRGGRVNKNSALSPGHTYGLNTLSRHLAWHVSSASHSYVMSPRETFFGFSASDPNHPYGERFAYVAPREWAIKVVSAYMR